MAFSWTPRDIDNVAVDELPYWFAAAEQVAGTKLLADLSEALRGT